MRDDYQLLYSEMLNEIICRQQLEIPEGDRVAASFWVAREYWANLRQLVTQTGLRTEEEEIYFFRWVKPRFTSHIEYYTMLAEALICVPSAPLAGNGFWEQEARRYQRFFHRHEAFIRYYDSNETYNDRIFFTRGNRLARTEDLLFDDGETDWITPYDGLARKYLAQRMYWETCRAKMGRKIN